MKGEKTGGKRRSESGYRGRFTEACISKESRESENKWTPFSSYRLLWVDGTAQGLITSRAVFIIIFPITIQFSFCISSAKRGLLMG